MNKNEKEIVRRFADIKYNELVKLPPVSCGNARIDEASLFYDGYCIARKVYNSGTDKVILTSLMRSVAGCQVSDKALNAAWETYRALPNNIMTVLFPGELPAHGSTGIMAKAITASIDMTLSMQTASNVPGGIDAIGEVIESAKKMYNMFGLPKADTIIAWERAVDAMYNGRSAFMGEASGVADYLRRREIAYMCRSWSEWPADTSRITDDVARKAKAEAEDIVAGLRAKAGRHTAYVLATILWSDTNSLVCLPPAVDMLTVHVISSAVSAECRPYGGASCYGNPNDELFFMRADNNSDGTVVMLNKGGVISPSETGAFCTVIRGALESKDSYRASVGYHVVERRIGRNDIYIDGLPYNRDIVETTADLLEQGVPGQLYRDITAWATDATIAMWDLADTVKKHIHE